MALASTGKIRPPLGGTNLQRVANRNAGSSTLTRVNTGPETPKLHPLRYTRSGHDPVGGNCHTCYVGKWTVENPGGLPLALPAPNRSGFVCVLEQRASRPHGEGPERQARGLEFEANHDMGQAPA